MSVCQIQPSKLMCRDDVKKLSAYPPLRRNQVNLKLFPELYPRTAAVLDSLRSCAL